MKSNLKRLVPAIERELREAAARHERQGLQTQLRHAQKMEAVGRLAGGVAHDFNNLLTAIMGYGQLMAMRMKPDDPARRDTEEILKAATRASLLTRQLLAFSRREVLQPRLLDLNAIVADMGKMLRRLIGESIDLVVVPGENLCAVKADLGHMEQVLMNLSVNARDAMPEGGRLTIETSNIDLGEVYVGEHVGVKPGGYVLLTVSDNGTGMDEETRARIFEPFFTTKGADKGTGLGLSTVYGIVQQWEGAIQVYSDLGRGTSFKVFLPRSAGTAEPTARAENLAELPRGSETVLLVEDQDAVAAVIRATLHLCGYQVLEAHNGSDAVALLKRHGGPIHLLLTDIVMPAISGGELAVKARELRPKTRVLLISGFSERAFSAQATSDPGFAFLQKPFMPESLARKVREVLDENPSGSPIT
jgi:two-component system cell cycle sensor histidine kinase/response regulator CckA